MPGRCSAKEEEVRSGRGLNLTFDLNNGIERLINGLGVVRFFHIGILDFIDNDIRVLIKNGVFGIRFIESKNTIGS